MVKVLDDLLKPGLRLVICGTAVGNRSAREHAYYAGGGNQLWEVLYKTSLTPRKLDFEKYRELLEYGIGLTDLVKTVAGPDRRLRRADYDCDGFTQKLKTFEPKFVAFNGKKAAKVFLDHRHIQYGLQDHRIGSPRIFIAPSTSAAAKRWWSEGLWCELADLVKRA